MSPTLKLALSLFLFALIAVTIIGLTMPTYAAEYSDAQTAHDAGEVIVFGLWIFMALIVAGAIARGIYLTVTRGWKD